MVSLLQDQSNIKFSSSDTLERDQHDLMKTQGDSISPVQQSDNPSYSCQPYESGVRTERKSSESSHSPSPASPAQTQIQGRYPTSQGIPCGKNKFKASFSTEKFRRFSYEDRTVGNYEQFLQSSRSPFHPYKRQVSEEVFQETPQALPPEASPFKPPRSIDGFEGLPGSAGPAEPESFPTALPTIPAEQPWCSSLQFSPPAQEHSPQLMQDSDMKLRTSPLEGQPGLYCYQPQVQEMYCPSHPFHQYPPGGSYPVTYIASSHYPYQRIAPQSSQDSQQPLFPKPIYSYSILIFMALKNSKTGSLPVSEIYNFMTEHFPYFKTAPDGWKNSVRHNLSLNKCFEKVENKSGNSSRKGCLWALNPAKIDKMQEELQKWKRKDPVAVRKSMAKPEELDTLIGDKSEKLRCPVQPCGALCGPGVPQPGVPQPALPQPGVPQPALPQPGVPQPALPQPGVPQPGVPQPGVPQPVRGIPAHAVPAALAGPQPRCFPSPHGFPHGPGSLLLQPGEPQGLLVPGGAQGGLRSQPGSAQESPLPAQTPPRCALRALPEPPDGQGELLPDGDLSSDIDALNPSLTDFELQGNLWEELKDDSLAVDPLVLISSSPLSPPCFPSPCHLQGGGSGSSSSISIPSAAPAGGELPTLYSAFLELDTVAPAYLSAPGSTPIALM